MRVNSFGAHCDPGRVLASAASRGHGAGVAVQPHTPLGGRSRLRAGQPGVLALEGEKLSLGSVGLSGFEERGAKDTARLF